MPHAIHTVFCGEKRIGLTSRLVCPSIRVLEGKPQRVLHNTWLREFGVIEAEPGVTNKSFADQGTSRVKSHRVRRIEHFPGEPQSFILGQSPGLGEARINSKKTGASEVIALS